MRQGTITYVKAKKLYIVWCHPYFFLLEKQGGCPLYLPLNVSSAASCNFCFYLYLLLTEFHRCNHELNASFTVMTDIRQLQMTTFLILVTVTVLVVTYFHRGYLSFVQVLPAAIEGEKLPRKEATSNLPETLSPGDGERYNFSSKHLTPMLILYWSKVFRKTVPVLTTGEHLTHNWPFFYAGKPGECPVACELSTDQSQADVASAFVVHARDTRSLPPSSAVPWILQTNENPVYTPKMRYSRFMAQFQLLVSYRLDSDFPAPIHPMPDLSPPVPFGEKYGCIMAVFSHCEKVRSAYMKHLMEYITVDSFGTCLHNKDGLTARYEPGFKQHKMDLARHYKFTLVFMNQDCDYFVDDRLYHALSSGSVPVFMGTDKVDEFLPGNLRKSIIKVRDFESPKDLADRLAYLSGNETAYNEYLEWKWKGLGNVSETVIGRWWMPKYPLFCQVCMALADKRLHDKSLKPIPCKSRSFEDWGI